MKANIQILTTLCFIIFLISCKSVKVVQQPVIEPEIPKEIEVPLVEPSNETIANFLSEYLNLKYKDRSFDFVTKLPPVSYYLKKAAKIKKGNSTPGRSLLGKVTSSDVEKIAKEKMQDLNAIDLNGAINMVKGSAVSMGMEVVN